VKSVGVASFALLLGLAAGPSFAQLAKAPASQAKPSAQRAAPANAGAKPVARSVFIASMDSEFRKMDADKNGTVTRAEIEAFERAVSVVKAQAKNRELFARLDADHSGQLSAAEFGRLASPAPIDAAPMLSRMDLNRDQSLTLVEYRTATLSNFDRLDADKNGVVTPAEMKAGGVGR
jgi:Ca2+-binding EF-hand superfamily protein